MYHSNIIGTKGVIENLLVYHFFWEMKGDVLQCIWISKNFISVAGYSIGILLIN